MKQKKMPDIKTENRLEELENKWKRAMADYVNLEKRVERERSEFMRFANVVLIAKILSVLDGLELAERNLKDKGLSIVVSQLRALLKEEGLEKIKADGTDFDPQLMEAVEKVDGQAGRVMGVSMDGYLLGGKVVRPAKVQVGNGNVHSEKKNQKNVTS